MIDQNYQSLWKVLPDWEQLFSRLRERLETNGNFARWCEAVDNLPILDAPAVILKSPVAILETTFAILEALERRL